MAALTRFDFLSMLTPMFSRGKWWEEMNAARSLWIWCLLVGLVAASCQRAEKVDPELGNQTVLRGTVTLKDDAEPGGVAVVAKHKENETIFDSTNTARDGSYRITDLPPGEYDVDATLAGYYTVTKHTLLVQGQETTLDFELEKIPTDVPEEIRYVSGGSNDGDPDQVGTVGQALAEPFVVEVLDGADQPLTDVQIIFQIIEEQDGGHMQTEGWMYTDDDGRVRNTYVLGRTAGVNQVRVQALGLQDQHVDFTPKGAPGAPAEIKASGGAGQAGLVAETLPEPIAVEVQDQYSNPVPDVEVTFTPSGDGQADPSSAQSNAQGRAQTTWTLGTEMALDPQFQTLTVTAGLVEAAITAEADHDLAVEMVIAGGNNQSGMLDTPMPEPLAVQVRDRFANPVDVVEVMLEVTFGQCILNPATPPALVTDNLGLVSTVATPETYGVIQVEASAQGLQPVTFQLTAVSGEPGRIVADSGSGQWGNIGETLAQPFRFKLLDIFENPVGEVWLHFEAGGIRGTPGTVDEQDVLTDPGGYTQVTLTLGTAAGRNAQWVTATATGFPQIAEAIIFANVFPDEPADLSIVSGDMQSQAFGGTLPEPLVVLVADQHGNPVPDTAVNWSSDASGSVTPNPSFADQDGQAYGVATLGADAGQPVQHFTAEANGASVTFTAQGLGHHIEQLIPSSVPPGYPDPDDPDPQNTLVAMRILGGGFEPGAVVVWDYWGTSEDVVPDTVSEGEIEYSLSADHFSAGNEGVYMVTVRNPDSTVCAPMPFAVTYSVPDSGQTDQQCTEYVYISPEWEWEQVDCSQIQQGTDYYGQDGHYHDQCNQPAFVINGDGTVTDSLTGLTWTRCVAGTSGGACSGTPTFMDGQDALAHCQDLVFAGYDDWLLPDIVELQQISDYSWAMPTIDDSVFPTPQFEAFWSETVFADDPAELWRWAPMQGRTEHSAANLADGVVRCVRARTSAPPDRFSRTEPLPDEPVVTDGMTGLVWQGCPAGLSGAACEQGARVTLLWPEALQYCEGLTWAGMDDWRLPQIKELFTVLDLGLYWPSVDQAVFPATGNSWYYSSTTIMRAFNDVAYAVFFGEGILGASFKDWDDEVLCVRSDY